MSAYALPGLFPPLPFGCSKNISIATSPSFGDSASHQFDYSSLEKEEKVEYDFPSREPAEETTPLYPGHGQFSVSVNESRIDTIQLIQSLTSSALSSSLPNSLSAGSKKRTRLRRRNSPPSLESSATTSAVSTAAPASSSPQELAMLFELEISWNGRHYTVVRSLRRMRQFREELVVELELLQWNKKPVVVPEFPSLPENGGSNQSFTLLQSQLRTHVPVLEAWLRKVFGLVSNVDDSATLTHFVLEPVCSLHSPVKQRLPLKERLPSLLRTSLTSIEEDQEDDEDPDS